jgi:ABC-type uncharacterized transport system auxiliary subunit
VLAALAVAPWCACGGKVPPTTVWSLRPPNTPPLAALAGAPRLGVARFTSLAELRTTDLTWREADGLVLQHYPYDAWSQYPDRMVEELALAALLASGRFAAVARTPPRGGLDAELSCRLVAFDEWDSPAGIDVKVALTYEVIRPRDGHEVVAAGRIEETGRAAQKSVEAVVRALDDTSRRAVARLVDDTARALGL